MKLAKRSYQTLVGSMGDPGGRSREDGSDISSRGRAAARAFPVSHSLDRIRLIIRSLRSCTVSGSRLPSSEVTSKANVAASVTANGTVQGIRFRDEGPSVPNQQNGRAEKRQGFPESPCQHLCVLEVVLLDV